MRIRDEHLKILVTLPSSNIVLQILESLHIFHKQAKINDMPSTFPYPIPLYDIFSAYISSIDTFFSFLHYFLCLIN